MKNKIVGYYSIFLGISIIAMWLAILTNEKPPEGIIEMSFHLFSEFLMACICILSGILLIKNNLLGKLLNFLGLGMVLYSVVNAAGYYGQLDNRPMMILFMSLFILTLIALKLNISKTSKT
jgi:hypothetical protein